MNEVAAPFLYLNPPPNGEALSYVLFEGPPNSLHHVSLLGQLLSFAILRTSSVEMNPLSSSKPFDYFICFWSMSIPRLLRDLRLSSLTSSAGPPFGGAAFPPRIVFSSMVSDSLQSWLVSPFSPQVCHSQHVPPHPTRLWDMMIAVDDPAFTFFVGLALLRLICFFSSWPEIFDSGNLKINFCLRTALISQRSSRGCLSRSLHSPFTSILFQP